MSPFTTRWTVRPSGFTAVRDDGAKVGAFWPNGRMVWWGYDPSGNPTGPHGSMTDAKRAVDAALFLA